MSEAPRTLDFMQRALELAERAKGWSSPNPAVGAVLVSAGQIVGEGWTQPPGGPHAEIVALRMAEGRARGSDLFVTLEPCAHFGRTPPCTDALIAAGIHHTEVAMLDASPWVAGKGLEALRGAGISVSVGARGEQAQRLNEAYFKWVETHRPFVDLKYAMTADGKIATHTGSSKWVTGQEARGLVAHLRSQMDAVAVGIGTVLADDPLLTSRPGEFGIDLPEPVHQPLRVVFDSQARLPLGSRILNDAPERTLVLVGDDASSDRVSKIRETGATVELLPKESGHVSIEAALDALGERGVTSVLAECGGTLAGSLLDAGAVDKMHVFISPKIVGSDSAPGPIGGMGKSTMAEAWSLAEVEWSQIGEDLLMCGYVRKLGPKEIEGA
jgi:diaminohydroxyphosphoribosylaminopyrimidine deaminase / 5-amino-6-(5-phosphoribosylamino)uracil reductase